MQPRLIIAALLIVTSLTSKAQLDLPAFSPEGRMSQKVGYTMFNVRYERPLARGRKIFGELVPYGTLWRTGAGKCTTLQIDQPIWIDNQKINPGIYALLSIPGKKQWTMLLNSDTSKVYGAPYEYDVKTEIARFTVVPEPTSRFYESFTIDLDQKYYQAELYLSWERTTVHFSIQTNTNELVDQQIKDVLAKNPNDHESLAFVGYYYKMNKKDLNEVLLYLDRALAIQEDAWYYREKVETLLALKKDTQAKQTADKAISFLKKTKPAEWELQVSHFEEVRKKL
jgi:hypothetical protein